MPSNMQYYVRTADGKEYGPAEQDVLIQWAKSGRITSTCQVRNALVRKWAPAKKISFLEDVVRDETEAKKKILPQSPEEKDTSWSLNQRGKFRYVAASTGLRFGAWCVDALLVTLVAIGIFYGCYGGIQEGGDPQLLWPLATALVLAAYLAYYLFLMGTTAQTVGQWFFGIMVTRPNGKPVLMGRACCFAVAQLLLGWTTLLFVFVLPNKRALQDMVSGLVVSRITVREIAASSV